MESGPRSSLEKLIKTAQRQLSSNNISLTDKIEALQEEYRMTGCQFKEYLMEKYLKDCMALLKHGGRKIAATERAIVLDLATIEAEQDIKRRAQEINRLLEEAANKAYLNTSTDESDCPISQEIMRNPWIAADGFTYEHDSIKHWLQNHDTSPMTSSKLGHKTLTPNHAVKSAVQDWSDRCLIHNS